jgi:LmbE family N-acetylglucosaminyl deacetylase
VPQTLVTFHAHPDDEAIATGGVMARAAADGHRVVLVLATRGELGEVDDGLLAPGETLADRRIVETARAAAALGVARVEYLGYTDSGMDGEDTNHAAGAFWAADLDEAAGRLAAILREERADVLTVYDEHGQYGHPDHIQVHRVGVRASELAATPRVYESTMNRDHIKRLLEGRPEFAGEEDLPDPVELETLGSPESAITTTVDVREFVQQKRAAMAAHASQISESSFFLAMPPEAFREAFGWEWFIRRGPRPDRHETSLFDEL